MILPAYTDCFIVSRKSRPYPDLSDSNSFTMAHNYQACYRDSRHDK